MKVCKESGKLKVIFALGNLGETLSIEKRWPDTGSSGFAGSTVLNGPSGRTECQEFPELSVFVTNWS